MDCLRRRGRRAAASWRPASCGSPIARTASRRRRWPRCAKWTCRRSGSRSTRRRGAGRRSRSTTWRSRSSSPRAACSWRAARSRRLPGASRSSAARSEVAEARPGRAEGSRLIDVELGDGRRVAAEQFVFACGPWLPTLFPEVAGDLIAVTKQDVVFVGPRAGDTRFGAASLPCWIDYDASYYGVPAVDGRGFKIAPDRYGEPFDPIVGRPARRPRLDPPRSQLPGAPLPRPRRRADPRDPHLPVRDDPGHELRHRPPSGVRQRVARRGWVRPRLQARTVDRPLRDPAARRTRGRGRGDALPDRPLAHPGRHGRRRPPHDLGVSCVPA